MSGIRERAIYERVKNPTMARVKYATMWLPRKAKTTSPAKNRNTERRRRGGTMTNAKMPILRAPREKYSCTRAP